MPMEHSASFLFYTKAITIMNAPESILKELGVEQPQITMLTNFGDIVQV
jgi:hypothetical protein